MTDAFDSDVLIYVALDHELGGVVRTLFEPTEGLVGIGSLLLLPEVLSKPLRQGAHREVQLLRSMLAQLELKDVDRRIARFAADLGARHRLRAADAVHLATAVIGGADRFITNNRRDFPTTIEEIDIVYPDML